MDYAFIKNKICVNVVVFDNEETVNEFETTMKNNRIVDNIIELPTGFGMGDKYEDGIWTKTEPIPEQPKEPTQEERIALLEETINFLIGF